MGSNTILFNLLVTGLKAGSLFVNTWSLEIKVAGGYLLAHSWLHLINQIFRKESFNQFQWSLAF